MSNRIILLIVSFYSSLVVTCQSHLLYSNQRFGVATNYTLSPQVPEKSLFTREGALRNKYFRLRYDVGILIGYEYKLIKSTNTFVFSSFEFSQSIHDFKLNEWTFENIDVLTRRNALHFGVRQRFSFWEGQLQLGIGLAMVKRFFPEDKRTYIQNTEYISETNIVNWEYKLTTFHDGHHMNSGFIPNRSIINFEFDVFTAFKINDYLNLKLNFMYNRNNQIHYLLGFRATNYHVNEGYTTITEFSGHTSFNNSKKFTLSHHFYMSIGIEVNLDKLYVKVNGK